MACSGCCAVAFRSSGTVSCAWSFVASEAVKTQAADIRFRVHASCTPRRAEMGPGKLRKVAKGCDERCASSAAHSSTSPWKRLLLHAALPSCGESKEDDLAGLTCQQLQSKPSSVRLNLSDDSQALQSTNTCHDWRLASGSTSLQKRCRAPECIKCHFHMPVLSFLLLTLAAQSLPSLEGRKAQARPLSSKTRGSVSFLH